MASDPTAGGPGAAGRGGAVIFLKPAEVYATAEEAREATVRRLEGELEQVRGLGAS